MLKYSNSLISLIKIKYQSIGNKMIYLFQKMRGCYNNSSDFPQEFLCDMT